MGFLPDAAELFLLCHHQISLVPVISVLTFLMYVCDGIFVTANGIRLRVSLHYSYLMTHQNLVGIFAFDLQRLKHAYCL